MKQLLEAGVHFGHQTRRWDPRMKPYIFTERNGIHIIDLQQTMKNIKVVHNFVKGLVEAGKTVLFVGTKKQAQQTIADEAARCDMYYINQRWMGGTLTNYQTIKRSIQQLQKFEEQKADGTMALRPRKEQSTIEKKVTSLNKSLGGIKKMKSLPGAVFIVDPKREDLAICEARKLGIPVIALADTNCNPEKIDYVIPGNDDAIRAINLITGVIADAVMTGRNALAAAAGAASAPEFGVEDIDETFAPTEEDLVAFEGIEDDFEEDAEEEVFRKKKVVRREGEGEVEGAV
jgi:small subunit ribosomal protein S2